MLFTKEQERQIIGEIRAAEVHTTGEIRVYVEDYCFRDHPVERAAEVFSIHKMHETTDRNGVLVYVAEHSRQYAIWGDSGITSKVTPEYWQVEKVGLRGYFREGKFAEGVIQVIREVGAVLAQHYPDTGNRVNELPDEIMYG